MTITIGIDPHKATHTAVAVDAREAVVGEHKVRASATQAATLIGWAQDFASRTWAVESVAGPGYLLAQQLVAAGETVADVPPVLAPGFGSSVRDALRRTTQRRPQRGHRGCCGSRDPYRMDAPAGLRRQAGTASHRHFPLQPHRDSNPCRHLERVVS